MRKKGITFKIFCITSVLLVVSALLIYLTLFFLLPNFYYKYKENSLRDEVETLILELAALDRKDAQAALSDFEFKHTIRIILQNKQGEISFPVAPTHLEWGIINDLLKGPMPGTWEQGKPFGNRENEGRSINFISITETVRFADDPEDYLLLVNSPVQPIDEAAKVILMFLPYMSVAIIMISMFGAWLYSNLISKPLLKLNQVAKSMADLDFSQSANVTSNDELGELSDNLNILAQNLQQSMNELRTANEQLKDDIQKEREQEIKRREFIATISHELKTPITAVSGQLEGMIHQIGSYKDRDKYLQQSYEIMREMEKLVHEILQVSQLDSFDHKPQLQKVNLSALLERTLESFLYFKDVKKLHFELDIQPDLYSLVDDKLIGRAIGNVLSNAVKYSGEGEEIRVSLHREEKDIRLLIINTGVHIDESKLEQIFQPFYRLEKSRNRKTGGSGLGLYIVKKILEMHHLPYSIHNIADGVQFEILFNRVMMNWFKLPDCE